MAKRGSTAWRKEAWGEPGSPPAKIVPYLFQSVRIQVREEAVPAFDELQAIMSRHSYYARSGVTGGFNHRMIAGTNSPSSHSWGTSVDVNWDTNPYRLDRKITDMPAPMINEILAIETVDGVQVFRWGGDWDGDSATPHSNYDAMHFEIVATPEELARGIARSQDAPALPDQPATQWPVLSKGSRSAAVAQLQVMLGAEPDSIFGPNTEKKVIEYQKSRGLTPDGIVGPATWTSIFTAAPVQEEVRECHCS